jgi:hypothetical protein
MHLELLRNTKNQLEAKGTWAEYKAAGVGQVPGAPIFTRERVEENVVAYASDLSALRMAYLIEKGAVDFYSRAARNAADPGGQRMFADLAKMEQQHLDLLEGEYIYLKGEFQSAMGFSPF